MAVDEVVNWFTVSGDNPSPIPPSPEGKRPRRVGLSMQEMMSSIARWRDTLSGVTGTILLQGTDPRLSWNETDATADNRYWDILPVAEQLRMRAVNDAQSVFTNWLTVDRTGNTIDLISLLAPVTITGAFTSPGIDDNATGERLELNDGDVVFGTSAADFTLRHVVNDRFLGISGGTSQAAGANIILDGGDHASTGDMAFRNDANTWMLWDESIGDLELLTGIGAKTAALTLQPDQDALFGGSILALAGTTGKPSLNIPEGVAPSSPVDGDMWVTTTDIFARINGVSESLISSAGIQGLGIWKYRTETVTPPASGQIRFNNADISLATEFYLHETTDGGTDVAVFLETLLQDGSVLYMQDQTNSANRVLIEISSSVDSGTYRTYGIQSVIEEGTEPTQNTNVILIASSAAGGGGDVIKVGTPVNDQVGVWTGDGTIEGVANLQFNGNQLRVETTSASARAGYFYSNVANRTQPLVEMINDNATGANMDILHIRNDAASGDGIQINSDGGSRAIYIEHTSSTEAMRIYTNRGNTGSDLVLFWDDNAAVAAGATFHIIKDGAGHALTVEANNAAGRAGRFYSNAANRTAPIVEIINDNPTGSGDGLRIQQDQTGDGIQVDSNGGHGVFISQNGTAGEGLRVYSNRGNTGSALARFWDDNAGNTGPLAYITKDGAGHALWSEANNAASRAGYFTSNIATRTVPVVDIVNDNPTGSGVALRVQNDQGGDAIDVIGNVDISGQIFLGPNGLQISEASGANFRFKSSLAAGVGLELQDTDANIVGYVEGAFGGIGFSDSGGHLTFYCQDDSDFTWFTDNQTVAMTLSRQGAGDFDLILTGQLSAAASSTAGPSLNIPEGVAPTAPVDGDIWVTAAGEFFARLNGSSVDLSVGAATSPGGADTQVQYNNGGAFGGMAEFTYDDAATTADLMSMVPNAGLTSGSILDIRSNLSTKSANLVNILQDHVSSPATALFITQDGSASGLRVEHYAASGRAAFFYSNTASRNSPLVEIFNDSPTGNGIALQVRNDATAAAAIDVIGSRVQMAAAATTHPSLNIPEGTAPSAPVDGDMWVTATDALIRVNGASKSIINDGDVIAVGTPVAEQVALWFSVNGAEGSPALTFTETGDILTIGDAGGVSTELHLDASAAGSPEIEFQQGAVVRARLTYQNTGSFFEITNTAGAIRMKPSGSTIANFSSSGLEFDLAAGIRLREAADHSFTPTATRGELWLKSDAPNVLMFTDDAATDHQIMLLSAAEEYTKQKNFNATVLSDGANISWNLDDNQVASVTLGGNRTLDNPTNQVDGATYILKVIQDATPPRTLAYGTAYKFPGGVTPVLSTGANEYDYITFISDGTNMNGVIQKNFS